MNLMAGFMGYCSSCSLVGSQRLSESSGQLECWGSRSKAKMMLGKFDHDLNQRPKPIDHGECKGNHPQMALIQVSQLF